MYDNDLNVVRIFLAYAQKFSNHTPILQKLSTPHCLYRQVKDGIIGIMSGKTAVVLVYNPKQSSFRKQLYIFHAKTIHLVDH